MNHLTVRLDGVYLTHQQRNQEINIMTNNQELFAIMNQWRIEQAKQSKREDIICNIIVTVLTSAVLSVIVGWVVVLG